MSEELSKTLDRFLAYTDIQSHHYGVPVLKKVRYGGMQNENEKWNDIQYSQKHAQLLESLDTLSYYHELKQLDHESQDSIDAEYQKILQALPLTQSDPEEVQIEEVSQLLKNQLTFRRETLLNSYLKITVPILKSLYHVDSNTTLSEVNISNNLQLLFSKDHEDLLSNVNKLMKILEHNRDATDSLTTQYKIFNDLMNQLKPKLQEVNQLALQVDQARADILTNKPEAFKDAQLDEKRLKEQFSQLIKQWVHIVMLANFLPNFIMCLPLDWYEDKVCFSIIKRCGKISEQFDNYLHLINKDSVKDLTIDDLLMLGLDLD